MILKSAIIRCCWISALLSIPNAESLHAQERVKATTVEGTLNNTSNDFYINNKLPLIKEHFSKLPVTAFKPGGWLKKQLELQRDGLTGNLGEISVWLSRNDNAWLSKEGKGKWGWEELPYWLKGYANMGYML